MIYFVQSGDYVKIGHCKVDPVRRMCKLQVGNPFKITLIALTEGGRDEERNWHLRFDRLHFRGEWFRFGPALKRAIKPFLVDHEEWVRNRPALTMGGYPVAQIYGNLEAIWKADAPTLPQHPKE